MKRIALLAGLAALLAGCVTTGRVTAYDISFTSEFRDETGQDVICDNRNTNVTIAFTVSQQPGAFVAWRTVLFGNQTGEYTLETGPNGQLEFSPNLTPGVAYAPSSSTVGRISYTVGIAGGTAPLRDAPPAVVARPQAVIVTPVVPVTIPFNPTPLGSTRLGLELRDDTGVRAFAYLGNRIRVVDNCP
jgi:hypothetical protein